MLPVELVRLTALMDRTRGARGVAIGLVDGPVLTTHPDLAGSHLLELRAGDRGTCAQAGSVACTHGTFVAGILAARRGAAAPGICPDCTLAIRPILPETTGGPGHLPSATPEELAAAIVACIEAGVRVVNLSLGATPAGVRAERSLGAALDAAARRGVVVVAAAGNDATLTSSTVTRHPWVIPVAACDLTGRPVQWSTLGSSIARHGLLAPGTGVTSLGTGGASSTLSGTSVAVPFVSGTVALLCSEFPGATGAQIRAAVTRSPALRRHSVLPPLLDAEAARALLAAAAPRRRPA
jgi:subtilisin family serine protease